jgi:hypothetical protein
MNMHNPNTGEVIENEALEQMARTYIQTRQAALEAKQEMEKMQDIADQIEHQLRHYGMQIGDRIRADRLWLVMTPPKRRAAQRVDLAAAERYSEQLLDIGLGQMAYKPPTAAQVRQESGKLIASGIPIDELLPDPGDGGRSELQIVATQED